MPAALIYYFAVFLELLFLISFITYWGYLIYSDLKGSPYVPTKSRDIERILKMANIKKGCYFYELGCGDGRVTRLAVTKFGVKGFGVDVNPILIWFANLVSRFKKLKHISFKTENIFDTAIKDANVVYLFLMPKLIDKMSDKLMKELKKKTIIISHGFKIPKLKSQLYKTLSDEPYPTYYYRL